MYIRLTHFRAGIYALGSSILLTVVAQAQPIPKRTLLAVSKVDHVLAIVDPTTFKVLGKVPVSADPHEVIASPDGKTAYVSNTGFGLLHTINVIDVPGVKVLDSIDTAPVMGPHGCPSFKSSSGSPHKAPKPLPILSWLLVK